MKNRNINKLFKKDMLMLIPVFKSTKKIEHEYVFQNKIHKIANF